MMKFGTKAFISIAVFVLVIAFCSSDAVADKFFTDAAQQFYHDTEDTNDDGIRDRLRMYLARINGHQRSTDRFLDMAQQLYQCSMDTDADGIRDTFRVGFTSEPYTAGTAIDITDDVISVDFSQIDLDDLNDVDTSGVQDDYMLVYDGGTSTWAVGAAPAPYTAGTAIDITDDVISVDFSQIDLDDLNDVDTSGVQDDYMLVYDAATSTWIVDAIPTPSTSMIGENILYMPTAGFPTFQYCFDYINTTRFDSAAAIFDDSDFEAYSSTAEMHAGHWRAGSIMIDATPTYTIYGENDATYYYGTSVLSSDSYKGSNSMKTTFDLNDTQIPAGNMFLPLASFWLPVSGFEDWKDSIPASGYLKMGYKTGGTYAGDIYASILIFTTSSSRFEAGDDVTACMGVPTCDYLRLGPFQLTSTSWTVIDYDWAAKITANSPDLTEVVQFAITLSTDGSLTPFGKQASNIELYMDTIFELDAEQYNEPYTIVCEPIQHVIIDDLYPPHNITIRGEGKATLKGTQVGGRDPRLFFDFSSLGLTDADYSGFKLDNLIIDGVQIVAEDVYYPTMKRLEFVDGWDTDNTVDGNIYIKNAYYFDLISSEIDWGVTDAEINFEIDDDPNNIYSFLSPTDWVSARYRFMNGTRYRNNTVGKYPINLYKDYNQNWATSLYYNGGIQFIEAWVESDSDAGTPDYIINIDAGTYTAAPAVYTRSMRREDVDEFYSGVADGTELDENLRISALLDTDLSGGVAEYSVLSYDDGSDEWDSRTPDNGNLVDKSADQFIAGFKTFDSFGFEKVDVSSTPYNIAVNDTVFYVTTSSSDVTVNLPDASTYKDRCLIIVYASKNGNYEVIVDPASGDIISGLEEDEYFICEQNSSVALHSSSDDTWEILSATTAAGTDYIRPLANNTRYDSNLSGMGYNVTITEYFDTGSLNANTGYIKAVSGDDDDYNYGAWLFWLPVDFARFIEGNNISIDTYSTSNANTDMELDFYYDGNRYDFDGAGTDDFWDVNPSADTTWQTKTTQITGVKGGEFANSRCYVLIKFLGDNGNEMRIRNLYFEYVGQP